MPFIGLSPFLHLESQLADKQTARVNALYRAFSISTLPSENALK